ETGADFRSGCKPVPGSNRATAGQRLRRGLTTKRRVLYRALSKRSIARARPRRGGDSMHPLPAERPLDLTWPTEGPSRVPYRVFFDPLIYELEQEKLFRGPTWNYVALEAELPTPGDVKAPFVGYTPVVVARDKAGTLQAFVNRGAHRGSLVCRELRGSRATH